MSKTPPRPKKTEYELARDTWYKKLAEDTDFEDAEQTDGNLKIWSSKFFLKSTQVQWEAKAAYYIMAEHFLIEHEFETPLDRAIWEYHSLGISYRDITKILAKANIKTNRTSIMHIINKYEDKMKAIYLLKNTDERDQ